MIVTTRTGKQINLDIYHEKTASVLNGLEHTKEAFEEAVSILGDYVSCLIRTANEQWKKEVGAYEAQQTLNTFNHDDVYLDITKICQYISATWPLPKKTIVLHGMIVEVAER